MSNARRITTATFGTIAAVAGLEHGIGEVLQGNVAPKSPLIESWPGVEFFRILSGEPAMTLVPNLLLTGVLTIVVSVLFLLSATRFAGRKGRGLTLILLSVVWLLVGGGFGPPLVGLIVGAAAVYGEARRPKGGDGASGGCRLLAALWPWLLGSSIAAWLCLFPGASILASVFGIESMTFIAAAGLSAFGLLLLTEVAGFNRDATARRTA